MDTIRNYLDSLFIGVPESSEIEKLRADLLANMEDHYHELINEGKNEHEAVGTVISTFGSIDELLEELNVEKETASTQSGEQFPSIHLSEAENYWKEYKRASFQLASGVLLSCLSFAGFLFFASYGSPFVGFACLLFGLAISIGFFIVSGMKINQLNHYVHHREVSGKVLAEARLREEKYRRSFGASLVLGIGFCICAFFPVIASLLWYMDGGLGATAFFITAGTGIFLIIYGSLVWHSYRQFNQSQYTW